MVRNNAETNNLIGSAINDLVYNATGFNTLEIALFTDNPSVGYKILSCARIANSASSENWAESTIFNGNGDAFRHCYWACCATIATNLNYALVEKWLDAHEDGTPNNPPLQSSMDKYNNYQGMDAAALAGATPIAPILVCLDFTKNGKLKIIKDGRLVPSTNEGRK